jgi:hypothetical protein
MIGRFALRLAKAEALPYWSIVVETCACRMSFCCTPTGGGKRRAELHKRD